MSLFNDPRDEDKLCDVLKAFVEEWGAEHVIVSLPVPWRHFWPSTLGRIGVEFATQNSISIRVEYGFVRVIYDVQLAA